MINTAHITCTLCACTVWFDLVILLLYLYNYFNVRLIEHVSMIRPSRCLYILFPCVDYFQSMLLMGWREVYNIYTVLYVHVTGSFVCVVAVSYWLNVFCFRQSPKTPY